MKIKKALFFVCLLAVTITFFSSCEEDFDSLGTNVIGDPNIEALFTDQNTVTAYSRELAPIQSNNLPSYQLGVYTDPTYGKYTANVLAQLTLDEEDPDFGENPMVESVTLYIPYFSTATQATDGVTYELDSIFGSDAIDISMRRSGYLLRDFDPTTGFEERQKYYSNQGPLFESFLLEEIFRIEDLVPSAEGFVENEGDDDEELISPGIRMQLPVEYFQENIIDRGGEMVLLNNNNFRDYFRGIYFDVDSGDANNFLFLFDITQANITIKYTNDETEEEDDPEEFQLEFQSVNLNVFDTELTPSIDEDLQTVDFENGEETLYVRGGSGIISVIELFGDDADNNGVADELELLREQEWLINEANLIFYVDDTQILGGETEPERLMIYDLKNSTALIDFTQDNTGAVATVDAIGSHLGRLERGSDDVGDFYKIRITSHISNLINRDSTNVPLGLVVSQNVLITSFLDLRNTQSPFISEVPTSTLLSPEGTVLHGSATTNEEKRLKLQIFYTEPN